MKQWYTRNLSFYLHNYLYCTCSSHEICKFLNCSALLYSNKFCRQALFSQSPYFVKSGSQYTVTCCSVGGATCDSRWNIDLSSIQHSTLWHATSAIYVYRAGLRDVGLWLLMFCDQFFLLELLFFSSCV